MSPVRRWFGRDRTAPAGPRSDAPAPPADAAALRMSLAELIRRVNASSGHLPAGAVVEIRDIGDRLGELLDHEERVAGAGGGADTYEMVTLASVVRDYLPTSVDAYLALPPAFLESHRNPEGETPAEELHSQLRIMEKGVTELAQAIYSGDAQRLSIQGRFLDAKFSSSDLDL
jgi:hypothetical protein